MHLGVFLRRRRTELGLTALILGVELGMDESNYLKIEKGRRRLSPAHWNRVSEILQVTLSEIVELDKKDHEESVFNGVSPFVMVDRSFVVVTNFRNICRRMDDVHVVVSNFVRSESKQKSIQVFERTGEREREITEEVLGHVEVRS